MADDELKKFEAQEKKAILDAPKNEIKQLKNEVLKAPQNEIKSLEKEALDAPKNALTTLENTVLATPKAELADLEKKALALTPIQDIKDSFQKEIVTPITTDIKQAETDIVNKIKSAFGSIDSSMSPKDTFSKSVC